MWDPNGDGSNPGVTPEQIALSKTQVLNDQYYQRKAIQFWLPRLDVAIGDARYNLMNTGNHDELYQLKHGNEKKFDATFMSDKGPRLNPSTSAGSGPTMMNAPTNANPAAMATSHLSQG